MMSSKPKISVVIPVYNGAKYIEECISSILNQDIDDYEIIIINDGSLDNTGQIVNSMAEKDLRIKVINQSNKGIVQSLNLGVSQSRGKYVARIDSDDIMDRSRLSIQSKYMDDNPMCVLSSSDYIIFSDDGRVNKVVRKSSDNNAHLAEMIFGPSLAHPTVMFKVDFFKEKQLWYYEDYKHAEDYELWIRVLMCGQICHIPRNLMRLRQHHQSITYIAENHNLSERFNIISSVHQKYLSFLGFEMSRNDLINHYRLSDRKRFILDPQSSLRDVMGYALRLDKYFQSSNHKLKKHVRVEIFSRVFKIVASLIIHSIFNLKVVGVIISKYFSVKR